ncbi:MAG: acyltransferase family protein [Candidatus Latescibacteria bacterium]|nr:acyltransferase family protein [Candidatus Latescibacterota bacterium]
MTLQTKNRLLYIDNIRILLISLIVLLHLVITYGGPGDWYYREIQFENIDLISKIVYALFNATVQAFALGFFFMISGYFTAVAYDIKGPWRFLKGRLLRLGLPLLFQVIVIHPVLMYALWNKTGLSFPAFMAGYFSKPRNPGFGPLWFVEALLLFSIIYVIWQQLTHFSVSKEKKENDIPGNAAIIIFALLVGLASFIVRIWLPVGWTCQPLNFQFPHFAQYISMFTVGTIAYNGNWFERLSDKNGKLWLKSIIILLFSFPVFLFLGGATKGDYSLMGGLNWQSLVYAMWEQLVCVGMIAGLTYLFRSHYDRQGKLAQSLSASAYTVFIIHAPVLVFLGLALKNIDLYPLLKFFLAALMALSVSFFLANVIRKFPLAKQIL